MQMTKLTETWGYGHRQTELFIQGFPCCFEGIEKNIEL